MDVAVCNDGCCGFVHVGDFRKYPPLVRFVLIALWLAIGIFVRGYTLIGCWIVVHGRSWKVSFSRNVYVYLGYGQRQLFDSCCGFGTPVALDLALFS